ncbi:MAG: hypothetical protein ACFE0I_16025 [Elainellaceae cyanobacterium]
MQENELAVLKADILAQRQAIERVFALLEERSKGLAPGNPEKLEGVAYQLHNSYSAIEDLLKLIASYFENNVSNTSHWHSLLLQRMTQSIDGVRLAVISTESYGLLNSLRAFRHFFDMLMGFPFREKEPEALALIRVESSLMEVKFDSIRVKLDLMEVKLDSIGVESSWLF